ncbi:cyclic pyranopterin monophosphate synthase MoaC [Alicyclobacillus fastidiosus]|uniref:Cyclic pyranopterin monophosphate synthase n=1 Tax=Alicyclobacillus fastidiosus TaxID=392011 RepID=A0ABY6ZCU9_9BACL|nr:cyclic pyranopterin monophosphate synthase MoaC [Alicyclobacillus fastidiosus]WAH40681.1 cyclic pyranopterin monophosphate synthase MoaC [Alicyclobacillus fastidiosus]GMA62146.1 cyclic pyranopterin monophosphate synthase accessory protein [Alicyclobacillus fastidiosus]
MSEKRFTHFTEDGRPVMVNVTEKLPTKRTAIAESTVKMRATTRDTIVQQGIKKGDVLAVAQLAGIMAAKKTFELIPLCHQVPLHHISLTLAFQTDQVEIEKALLHIEARVETSYQTGVEMEALTACSIAALTVYDMCKAIDRGMEVSTTRLVYKNGGKSGLFQATPT